MLTFNPSAVASGVYLVRIEDKDNVLKKGGQAIAAVPAGYRAKRFPYLVQQTRFFLIITAWFSFGKGLHEPVKRKTA